MGSFTFFSNCLLALLSVNLFSLVKSKRVCHTDAAQFTPNRMMSIISNQNGLLHILLNALFMILLFLSLLHYTQNYR